MTDSPDIPAYRSRWLLVGILLLAALLRLQKVTQPLTDTFSWREASTAMMADNFYRTNPNIFFPEVSWTGPGPNYQGREFQTFSWIVAMIWRATGHQSETVGRLLSIAFGMLGVFSIYKLVRRVWDEARGLAAALVLAVTPGALFIDRSFLPDPAMLGLTLLASWLVVRAAQTGRGLWVAALMSALAFLTKLPGIVALPMMVYVATRPHALRPTRGQLIVALVALLVPVVAYYAWAIYLGTHYPPYHVAGSANWLWTGGNWRKFIAEFWYVKSTFGNLTYWFWTVPVFGMVIAGLILPPPRTRLATEGAVPDVRWAFHLWLGGCAVLYALGARELSENVWNYHVFNVFAAAFAGHALVVLATWADAGARATAGSVAVRVGVFVLATIAFGAIYLHAFFNAGRRYDNFRMGRALERFSSPGELVVTIADDVGDPVAIYYSRRRGWVYPSAHRTQLWPYWNMLPDDLGVAKTIFDDLRDRDARWLGIANGAHDDAPGKPNIWKGHPDIVAYIESTCDLVERTDAYSIYRIVPRAELAARAATRPTTTP